MYRSECWHLLIFPGSFPPSIFSASELNFRVRYGNGWTLAAINTNFFCLSYRQPRYYNTSISVCQAFFEKNQKIQKTLIPILFFSDSNFYVFLFKVRHTFFKILFNLFICASPLGLGNIPKFFK